MSQRQQINPIIYVCLLLVIILSVVQIVDYSSAYSSTDTFSFNFQNVADHYYSGNSGTHKSDPHNTSSESCLDYKYFEKQAKEKAELELEDYKKELAKEFETTNHKIGHFDYNPNDIFDYDIGRKGGEPSFHRFFNEYFDFYLANKQTTKHPQRVESSLYGKPDKLTHEFWRISTDDFLPQDMLQGLLDTPRELVADLKGKHKIIADAMPSTPPFPFYNGSGYILIADGFYMWQSLLNIRVFRKLGSKLPIELLVTNDKERDNIICTEILPNLNARCIFMSDVFGKEVLEKIRFGAFQYKALGLIASTFNNVMIFDSDAMPVRNPDYLFDWEIYHQYGMLTWPDIARRTTSPDFYEIQGIKIENEVVRKLADVYTNPKYYFNSDKSDSINWEKDVNFHDRKGTPPDWSTESGSMLIRKSSHFDVVLLALYYNMDGPYGYFPLLTQDGPGEGDKETWVMAAQYYHKLYYQTSHPPHHASYDNMYLQGEPVSEFKLLSKLRREINEKLENGEEYDYDKLFHHKFETKDREFLYYHLHSPKWDPYRYMKDKVTEKDGKDVRVLGENKNVVDLELIVYHIMFEDLCELKYDFPWFKDGDSASLCKFLTHRIEFLSETTWSTDI